MSAFVLRLSGLRDLVRFQARTLGTQNFSSLSHALSRDVSLRFVQHLVESLEGCHRPGSDELVALDSMPLTLPRSLRHRCAKVNRNTVGGGVLWSYALNAARGCCPVKVQKVIAGPWLDAGLMDDVALIANGPVYLMDRGFVNYRLIRQWLCDNVRFVLRLRDNTVHEVLATLSRPRPYGSGRIERDVIVRLGSSTTEVQPIVRLIVARLRTRAGTQPLLLTTSENDWTAEQVLDAYKQRTKIEEFHQFLKQTVGLAHLYSFSQTGVTFLLYTALLLAMILFLSTDRHGRDVLTAIRAQLETLRLHCGLGHPWRRNMNARKRDKAAKVRDKLKRKKARNL